MLFIIYKIYIFIIDPWLIFSFIFEFPMGVVGITLVFFLIPHYELILTLVSLKFSLGVDLTLNYKYTLNHILELETISVFNIKMLKTNYLYIYIV